MAFYEETANSTEFRKWHRCYRSLHESQMEQNNGAHEQRRRAETFFVLQI